jgi:dihydrofolate reductase
MHISLDGFCAGPNGEMDWIKVDEEIFDYIGDQIDRSDTGLYGRVTYEMMESYWPTAAGKPGATKHDIQHSNWYNSANKIVLSKSMKESKAKTKVLGDNIAAHINNFKKEVGTDIVMFGSPSAAHTLMQHNLIDEYWINVNPIVLGKGIPFFNVKEKSELTLLTAKTFSSGVVGLHYKINL